MIGVVFWRDKILCDSCAKSLLSTKSCIRVAIERPVTCDICGREIDQDTGGGDPGQGERGELLVLKE